MEYRMLSSVCEYRKDRIPAKKVDENNYISTENMLPDKRGIEKASSIAEGKTLPAYKEGDILLSNIRPYFKKIWFANKTGGCSNDVLVLKSNDSVDKKFLYYVLSDNNFFNYSTVTSKGTKMPRGSKHAIMKYLVPDIDLPGQKRIADVLSAYDDLIESNNKRIALLEKAAQELYREWFVRFRFPGHENIELKDSALGHIPENFDVVKTSDVLSYYIGGGWGEEDESTSYPCDAYVIRGTDFPKINNGDWSTCPYRYHKKSNYEARKLEPWDIVLEVSGGTQEQPVGRTLIVTTDLLKALSDKVICASFCKQLRCDVNVISPIYYYYWMQFLYDTRIMDKFQLQSTGIINFKFEYFHRKGDVLLPPRHIMDEFDNRVKQIFKLKDDLALQNRNLIKQRDLLLPRLMSGKLEV